jgi:hypothetical protein
LKHSNNEIRCYRKELSLKLHADANKDYNDPLLWWKEKQAMFPTLVELAKIYLALQATLAPSEKVSVLLLLLPDSLNPVAILAWNQEQLANQVLYVSEN